MFERLNHRGPAYAVLVIVWALTCLPFLGSGGLWDIDEGNNAEAAREMYLSGKWIVPTFNYSLRTDKPALLYWLQIVGYSLIGINETAARLPSALAMLCTVLTTYELGRRIFSPGAGFLGAFVLGTSVAPLGAAHFANPDALLLLATTLALTLTWCDWSSRGKGWFIGIGIALGLGVLAKGPVGLVLPTAVVVLFLLWQERSLRYYLDLRVISGSIAFVLTAIPWYAWVSAETKGEWLYGFLLRHNLERATTVLESHSGPVYYYLLVALIGFAPWSIFGGTAIWHTWKRLRRDEEVSDLEKAGVRFLICYVAVYFVAFSLVRTKLPNYVLPAYPAAALLLGHFLDRWRRGETKPAAWLARFSLASLAFIGGGVTVGVLLAAGVIVLPSMRGRAYPELLSWVWLGPTLTASAVLAWVWLERGLRDRVLGTVAVTAVLFLACMAGPAVVAMEPHKATRTLASALPTDFLQRDVKVGTFGYFQPSLVFYCRREVERINHPDRVLDLLESPVPAYLFLPESHWDLIRQQAPSRTRVLTRHRDLYTNQVIVLATTDSPS